jgi:hypothetical protein
VEAFEAARAGAVPVAQLAEETHERLRELGYVER